MMVFSQAAGAHRSALTSKGSRRLPVALCLAVVLVGCSGNSSKLGDQSSSTTTTPTASSTTSTTNPNPPVSIRLFFLRGATLAASIRVENTRAARYSTVKALFGGPDPTEKRAGLSTDIPTGSAVEGLTQINGIAYLDVNPTFFLSGTPQTMQARVAQVVFTLTASPGVNGVEFTIRGARLGAFDGLDLANPVGRDAYISAAGPVLLEAPAVGGTATSPLAVQGTAEMTGTIEMELMNPEGLPLAPASVLTVSPGVGFEFSIPYSQSGKGTDTFRLYAAAASGGPSRLLASLNLAYASSS